MTISPERLLQPARSCRFTVLDFETTGSVPGWTLEPWQIGLVSLCRDELDGGFDSLLRIDPARPFNPHAPGRHARLRGELARAPTLGELWPRLAPWLEGRALVAHNIGTERGLLQRAAPLHRFGPWIDTLRLVRRHYPDLASAALEDVVTALGLKSAVQGFCADRAPHDAYYDAVACALLLRHFLRLPGWETITLATLIAAQRQ